MHEKPQLSSRSLTGSRLLARNIVWNLFGQAAPLAAALVTIPPLIAGLGIERFGVLTLAWTVIGYFSLFDLGIGRAVTKVVAEMLGEEDHSSISAVARTAITLMLLLGTLGGAILAAVSPWLVESVLNISPALRIEVTRAFYLLAVSVPVVVTSAGLRGILEAYQKFSLLNRIRVPSGIFMFVGPLIVSAFTDDLTLVVASLAAIRYVVWAVHWYYCRVIVNDISVAARFNAEHARRLMQFGGWMTVTNIVGPLMVYMDRFLIGGMLSVAAVAYYVAPYEIVTKLWIIPGALIGVLFPAFAASFRRDKQHAARLVSHAVKYIFIALFPIALVAVAFAKEGLQLWLGKDFAANSTQVLQWLAIGVYVNSIAQVPSALIQGAGRPDITAKLHLAELPCYLVALVALTAAYGIEGAACAWAVRVGVDAAILIYICSRMLPGSFTRGQALRTVGGLVVLIVLLLPVHLDIHLKVAGAALALLAFAVLVWAVVLDDGERIYLKRLTKTLNEAEFKGPKR